MRTSTAQQLCIKYVYRQVHAKTEHQIYNDCKLPKDDDAGTTVSVHGRNNDKQYQPTTLRIGRDFNLPSKTQSVSRSYRRWRPPFKATRLLKRVWKITWMEYDVLKLMGKQVIPFVDEDPAAREAF